MKARIFNARWWIAESDSKKLYTIIDKSLMLSGFTILDFVDHTFEPHGYTGLWLLGESHAAIHTFPEEEQAYIEISSCVEEYLILFKEMLDVIAIENGWRISNDSSSSNPN